MKNKKKNKNVTKAIRLSLAEWEAVNAYCQEAEITFAEFTRRSYACFLASKKQA